MRGTTFGRWVLRGLAIGSAVLAPVGYVDLAGPLPPIQAGLPLAGVGALAVGGILTVRRDWWPAAMSLVAAALMTGPVLVPGGRPAPTAADDVDATPIRLLSLNVQFGRAHPEAVVALIEERRSDVVVLTEMTPDGWRRLEAAGLRRHFPHATGRTDTGASGTVILSRRPFTCLDTVERNPCGQVVTRRPDAPAYRLGQNDATFDLPSVRLEDGTVIRGIHARPPSLTANDRWRREQHDLATWVRDQSPQTPLILAGDFNASLSHPAFRALADGLVHAPRTGLPWPRTWPEGARLPALIQIDHILTRGFAVHAEGVDVVPGTDHAAVWADLRRAQPG